MTNPTTFQDPTKRQFLVIVQCPADVPDSLPMLKQALRKVFGKSRIFSVIDVHQKTQTTEEKQYAD